ncbi:MAG: 30S ribosomal protein S5 [Bdellovibrionota bacterium]|nr:MAG: 30S ribosomal protein S5 [Pseudomonadota bacterium]
MAQEQGQGQGGGRDQGRGGNRDNRDGGNRGGRDGQRRDGGNDNQRDDNLQDRVVNIARVAKVVKGGRRFSFSALVVVGDGKDMVGFGLGKANEVPDAIRKGGEQAKKDMIKVRKVGNTIPYEVVGRYGSAKVLMYPAKQGKGIIAGGAVRIIAELAGIHDIVCKVHGTRNHQNVVRAVIDGLKQLESIEDYARNLGKEAVDVLQSRH